LPPSASKTIQLKYDLLFLQSIDQRLESPKYLLPHCTHILKFFSFCCVSIGRGVGCPLNKMHKLKGFAAQMVLLYFHLAVGNRKFLEESFNGRELVVVQIKKFQEQRFLICGGTFVNWLLASKSSQRLERFPICGGMSVSWLWASERI